MMPLKKGYSKKSQDANFHELKKTHPEMPPKQRAAIVLNTARKARKQATKRKKSK